MAGRARSFTDVFKTNIVLRQTHAMFLDRLSFSIREKTGVIIDRSAIIRAMSEALQSSGLDLSEVRSEEELAAMLAARLAGTPAKAKRKPEGKGD